MAIYSEFSQLIAWQFSIVLCKRLPEAIAIVFQKKNRQLYNYSLSFISPSYSIIKYPPLSGYLQRLPARLSRPTVTATRGRFKMYFAKASSEGEILRPKPPCINLRVTAGEVLVEDDDNGKLYMVYIWLVYGKSMDNLWITGNQ